MRREDEWRELERRVLGALGRMYGERSGVAGSAGPGAADGAASGPSDGSDGRNRNYGACEVCGVVLRPGSVRCAMHAARRRSEAAAAVTAVPVPEAAVPVARAGSGQPMGLTTRQLAIVRGMALGQARKWLAAELELSLAGVEYHLGVIEERLGFHDAARLTHWAIVHGVVKAGEAL